MFKVFSWFFVISVTQMFAAEISEEARQCAIDSFGSSV